MKTNTQILLAVVVACLLAAGWCTVQAQHLAKDKAALQKQVSALSLELVQLKASQGPAAVRLAHHQKRQAELYAELAAIKGLPPHVYTPDDLGP